MPFAEFLVLVVPSETARMAFKGVGLQLLHREALICRCSYHATIACFLSDKILKPALQGAPAAASSSSPEDRLKSTSAARSATMNADLKRP